MRIFISVLGNCLSFALLTAFITPVLAQAAFSCKAANGQYMPSYTPCSTGVSNGLVYYPPIESGSSSYRQPQRYEAPLPRAQDVEAHVQYMSPVCAGLNDTLRTASSRGISGSSINDMRRDYRSKCQDNESEAHERLSKARGEKKLEKLETQKAEKVDSERASIRAQQCGESKRILTTKRARTDLTDGEKSDLQRFEDNYRSRCG